LGCFCFFFGHLLGGWSFELVSVCFCVGLEGCPLFSSPSYMTLMSEETFWFLVLASADLA